MIGVNMFVFSFNIMRWKCCVIGVNMFVFSFKSLFFNVQD